MLKDTQPILQRCARKRNCHACGDVMQPGQVCIQDIYMEFGHVHKRSYCLPCALPILRNFVEGLEDLLAACEDLPGNLSRLVASKREELRTFAQEELKKG